MKVKVNRQRMIEPSMQALNIMLAVLNRVSLKKSIGHELENNDCATCVFMVLFRNQRLLFWSEEFAPEGQFRMTKTTTDDFQTKP